MNDESSLIRHIIMGIAFLCQSACKHYEMLGMEVESQLFENFAKQLEKEFGMPADRDDLMHWAEMEDASCKINLSLGPDSDI